MHHNNAPMPRLADKRDHQLTIRIPKRLREALDREAAADRRSVADIVVNMLEDRYGKRARGGQ
jgi:predicted HicB family RNase H-like nuclease